MGRRRTAIVVGGGVIGVTSAYTLARDGWQVRLLDRCTSVAQGASRGNGRQLSYSHTNALAGPGVLRQIPGLLLGCNQAFAMTMRGRSGYAGWLLRFLGQCTRDAARRNTLAVFSLAQESRRAMDDLLATHPIHFDRKTAGKLVVLHSQQELDQARALVEAKRQAGLVQSVLSADQACEVEPALARSPQRIAGALYAPEDETGDCHAFCHALMQQVQQAYGVQFKGGAQVSHITRAHGQSMVHLSDGDSLQADLVIVANGHAANDLLTPLGHHLPIQPMKGYSFTAPLGNAAPRVSVTDSKRRIVFTHCGDRMLVAGIAEMGQVDTCVDPQRLETMVASARAALPEAAVYSEADSGWAGLRPMTPNSQPVIGMLEPGLAVNGGHGMLGWTLAMGSAERLSRAVSNSHLSRACL